MELNAFIDHTNLKPNATAADIEKLCDEARAHGFATVAINGCWTALAAERLAGSGVGISTCIGFPLGAMTTEAKAFEAARAAADGTTEIIAAVVEAAPGIPVKVILECCLLDDGQIVRGCKDSVAAGAAFVKTSTGFSKGGATLHDVALMRAAVGDGCRVKAAGGIHNADEARAMIEAGADRIGTSSGIAIVEG